MKTPRDAMEAHSSIQDSNDKEVRQVNSSGQVKSHVARTAFSTGQRITSDRLSPTLSRAPHGGGLVGLRDLRGTPAVGGGGATLRQHHSWACPVALGTLGQIQLQMVARRTQKTANRTKREPRERRHTSAFCDCAKHVPVWYLLRLCCLTIHALLAQFNGVSRAQSTNKTHVLLNGNVDKDNELLDACMPESYNVQAAFNTAQATNHSNLADGTYTGSVVIIQDIINRIQALEDILFYRCTDNTCGGAILNNICNLCNKRPDAQIHDLQPHLACLILGNNNYEVTIRSYEVASNLWGKLRHGNNGNHDFYRALLDANGLERVLGRMRQAVQHDSSTWATSFSTARQRIHWPFPCSERAKIPPRRQTNWPRTPLWQQQRPPSPSSHPPQHNKLLDAADTTQRQAARMASTNNSLLAWNGSSHKPAAALFFTAESHSVLVLYEYVPQTV
ncbi:hypothetical protein VOLCADRAFT_107476 [Volvox carteri f. nagariensis]|uniref:Uncharacterized protein n=1 Tax=Volvox carteri f. nagariensis TaxID=3068 RepID=D8UE76_VOLCA|nr:uncharacterized protein VOLCADRAFT_107476 [Volvox carteri f. nagariensis]EFJ41918.1 hypothetical protein VOLCADRAFT_107476 [Volvox carteri f. nagariensis]|eukprot:XP_002956955.1 hypothetical protein VOLCADRAFT_107476 [Volvox carteri f. nagariensis]